MKTPKSKQASHQSVRDFLALCGGKIIQFLKANWKGIAVMGIVTLVFFWPMVTRLDSYNEGGDAMFNAWTLARNQQCILGNNCPNYSDANIYFPHKDTMLYSETQLSAGVLTMPFYFINHNPIFSYNVWTILSYFFSAFFMYLLAKFLSKGHEVFSVIAGLVFAYAPFKISALGHLQNISIFYLPLILLMIFKYYRQPRKRYLVGLLIASVLLFYASWYQMVFALVAIGVLLLGSLLLRLAEWRKVLIVGAVVLAAVLSTLPLAKEYVRFSKETNAKFDIAQQAQFSSSLSDYVAPFGGTVLGEVYHRLTFLPQPKSYNTDSASYHGLILYVVALAVLIFAYRQRKRSVEASTSYKQIVIFSVIGVAGFIISLGPLLKLKGDYSYADLASGLELVVPLPYLLVDKFLPQLSFIRALGRASVLCLLALCVIVVYLPAYLRTSGLKPKTQKILLWAVGIIIAIEVMPIRMARMEPDTYHYNLKVPAVYEYIVKHKEINNLVILSADDDYPGAKIPVARAENVLWAGYHNRNIFNGYSGYTPPTYFADIKDFNDFQSDDVAKLRKIDVRYIIVDKQLSTKDPDLDSRVAALTTEKLYEDNRYALFKI